MLSDLGRFILAVLWDWVTVAMGGIGALSWFFIQWYTPEAPNWILWTIIIVALFIACFRVWRRAFHEARPYEAETFEHAKRVLASLSDEHKQFVERMCIQKYASIADGKVPTALKEAGMAAHEYSTGMWYLTKPYDNIVSRLLRQHGKQRRIAKRTCTQYRLSLFGEGASPA